MTAKEPTFHILAECPVGCFSVGVVAMTHKCGLFLFTPCCCTPWRPDLDNFVDFEVRKDAHLLSLEELEMMGLATRVLREEPMQGLVRRLRDMVSPEELLRLAEAAGEDLGPLSGAVE